MHKNTRFIGDPFSKALNKCQIQQAAALNAQVRLFFYGLIVIICTIIFHSFIFTLVKHCS